MSVLSSSVRISICRHSESGLEPVNLAQRAYEAAFKLSGEVSGVVANEDPTCLGCYSSDYYTNMKTIVEHLELPDPLRSFIGSKNEPLDWDIVAGDLNALYKAGIYIKLSIEKQPQLKYNVFCGIDGARTTLEGKAKKIGKITDILKTGYEKVNRITYGKPFAEAVPDFPRVLVNIVIEYLRPPIGE